MVEKINHYLKDEQLRGKIAEAGRKRVLNQHTYEIRMRQMVGMVEEVIF